MAMSGNFLQKMVWLAPVLKITIKDLLSEHDVISIGLNHQRAPVPTHSQLAQQEPAASATKD
jgi:hypothetical protein